MARAADRSAARAGHPPHRRPRPRDPVLDARQPPRRLRGSARRRPVRGQRRARASKLCRAARHRRPSSRTTRRLQPPSGAMPTSSARPVQVLGSSALALPRAEPFDLIFADPPYAPGSGTAAVQAVDKCRLARARRLDERRDQPRRPGRPSRPRSSRRCAMSAARGLRFCGLSLSRLPDFVDLGAQPPTDRRRRGLAGGLHRFAGAPAARAAVVKPCSASAASAAVAATATSSATSGLCSSFTNASLASKLLSGARSSAATARRYARNRCTGLLRAAALRAAAPSAAARCLLRHFIAPVTKALDA